MPIEKITETERFSVFYSIRAEIGWGNESITLWSLRVSFCNFLPNRDQTTGTGTEKVQFAQPYLRRNLRRPLLLRVVRSLRSQLCIKVRSQCGRNCGTI